MAGRRNRWVEAERKERQRNSTRFAALPDGNRAARGEKMQPARKAVLLPLCFFPPVSKSASASWPALN